MPPFGTGAALQLFILPFPSALASKKIGVVILEDHRFTHLCFSRCQSREENAHCCGLAAEHSVKNVEGGGCSGGLVLVWQRLQMIRRWW